jgi:hypothetical protein
MDKTQLEAIIKAAVEQALAAAQTVTPETLPFDEESTLQPAKRSPKLVNPRHFYNADEDAIIIALVNRGCKYDEIRQVLKIQVTSSAIGNRYRYLTGQKS